MPCYERNSVTIDWNVADYDMLEEALKEQGLTVRRRGETIEVNGRVKDTGEYVSGYLQKGQGMTLYSGGTEQNLNAMKRAYSRQIVKNAGSRFNWKVEQKNDRQFNVLKRF